ncbi:MAG: GreA/GreB family elongation factor [Myxococcales bacterium]|nr:GreA/GreB family elongation factor [Myxococcales bacterium]
MRDVKRALLDALRDQLRRDRDAAVATAKDAAAGATHEENRAEGDKDMRATESSYIARGQAARVAELEEAIKRIDAIEIRDFDGDSPIGASALVDLEHAGKRTTYLVVTAGGGARVEAAGVTAQTLSTQSPLGRALVGLTEGDEAELAAPQGKRTYEIVRVY